MYLLDISKGLFLVMDTETWENVLLKLSNLMFMVFKKHSHTNFLAREPGH